MKWGGKSRTMEAETGIYFEFTFLFNLNKYHVLVHPSTQCSCSRSRSHSHSHSSRVVGTGPAYHVSLGCVGWATRMSYNTNDMQGLVWGEPELTHVCIY